MSTTSSGLPNFSPTCFSNPARSNPHAACRPMELSLLESPITASYW